MLDNRDADQAGQGSREAPFQPASPAAEAASRAFRFLQELGNVDDSEMYRTFNMGMGFLVVVAEDEAQKACRIMGPGSKVIGSVVKEGLKAGRMTF